MSRATPTPRPTPQGRPLRIAVLNAARALFIAEGVEGISVRRVAEQAGCTTMALYTHFAGKDGLLTALFDEGFAELARAQQAVPASPDPVAYAQALCAAYRDTAHRFPHHYALMLGRFSGAHRPSESSAAAALGTLDVLVAAVPAALPAAATPAVHRDRASAVARRLFAFCHGWVSLESMQFIERTGSSEHDFAAAVAALLSPDTHHHATPRASRARPL